MLPEHRYRLNDAKEIVSKFKDSISSLQIDENFPQIVEYVLSCDGNIITTGMGKAGIAMRKFTSTLCSLGFPSAYLHPGEASHGDLGLISTDDILFVASTSGKTREVLEVIDLARNINVKAIIGITSHIDSPIREKADLVLDMGQVEEAGHLGLAPTSSILVMLALTDCVALVAAKERGLTKEEYGKYHHGGYLGSLARRDRRIY